MSDPFAEIDNEVYVEKIKSFIKKYKFLIAGILFIIIVLPSSIFFFNKNKEETNIKTSGYFIEILSLLQKNEEKAIVELEKLSKLEHEGFNFLSELIQAKINLKNKNFQEGIAILNKINVNINSKSDDIVKKLIAFYSAQAALELNDKSLLNDKIGDLLSYGESWALLGHEIRGHFYFKNKDYLNAEKDFYKILNEQQSSNSIRLRAQEMLQNIKMYNENKD